MSRQDLVTQAYQSFFGQAPQLTCHAPGRVNLIGEHTDYNGGFVFPAAINFGTDIAASSRDDRTVNVRALDFDNQLVSFSLDDIQFDNTHSWSNYIRGVLIALMKDYPQIKGADFVVSGNVPQGAGLSSSASFEIAILKCFASLNALPLDGIQAALKGQQAENEFVGCSCGIMDQLISAMGKKDQAMLLDCRSLEIKYSALPAGFNLFIVNSNVKRGLVDSEYNLRRQQCEEAAQVMELDSLRDADLTLLEANKAKMSDVAYLRARHVITENERTLAMCEALNKGETAKVSALMRASHMSMKNDFAITTSQIDELVEIIHQQLGEEGGVRMTGGGFGGCVVALVPDHLLTQVQQAVETQYQAKTGLKESIFICTAEQGAFA
ncbi:galactokinase [Catenovulum sp. 2E275]|uniref:galactokinase n=1 Tax=Catenovulum sp. 2E275 TaxID=2980497 RepID=UPI0021D2B1BD|nr:galactokinase [Catenovulum sp. 2E275]MCU4674537.1 galactokinase [Catenovulum sp. 2E275]